MQKTGQYLARGILILWLLQSLHSLIQQISKHSSVFPILFSLLGFGLAVAGIRFSWLRPDKRYCRWLARAVFAISEIASLYALNSDPAYSKIAPENKWILILMFSGSALISAISIAVLLYWNLGLNKTLVQNPEDLGSVPHSKAMPEGSRGTFFFKKWINRYVILTLFLAHTMVFPILGMLLCSGWNEGTGQVTSCAGGMNFLAGYANYAFGFLTISSFVAFLPALIYLASVAIVSIVILTWNRQAKDTV